MVRFHENAHGWLLSHFLVESSFVGLISYDIITGIITVICSYKGLLRNKAFFFFQFMQFHRCAYLIFAYLGCEHNTD